MKHEKICQYLSNGCFLNPKGWWMDAFLIIHSARIARVGRSRYIIYMFSITCRCNTTWFWSSSRLMSLSGFSAALDLFREFRWWVGPSSSCPYGVIILGGFLLGGCCFLCGSLTAVCILSVRCRQWVWHCIAGGLHYWTASVAPGRGPVDLRHRFQSYRAWARALCWIGVGTGLVAAAVWLVFWGLRVRVLFSPLLLSLHGLYPLQLLEWLYSLLLSRVHVGLAGTHHLLLKLWFISPRIHRGTFRWSRLKQVLSGRFWELVQLASWRLFSPFSLSLWLNILLWTLTTSGRHVHV